jgi:N utilization substance protein A
MENIALIDSFSEFKDDKLIDRVTLMAILEDVLRNALKKKYGDDDNFDIMWLQMKRLKNLIKK